MSWTRRLLNLLSSNRHARDIDRELAFHLTERADDLVARGMHRAAAELEARRRLGNYAAQKEKTREVDVVVWLDSLVDDVRYAARALLHSRAFALVAILSLGLGIGANTAIFTLINAVMLRSLPVAHPEELVQLVMKNGDASFTNPVWEQIRDHQSTFNGIFAYSTQSFNLASAGEVRNIAGSLVSGDFFHTLGLQAAHGRLLSSGDDRRGCPAAAVLSYAYWQSAYGGDVTAIGKTISLDSHPFQIIGVVQPGFAGLDVGRGTDVYAPVCADLVLRGEKSFLEHRSVWWLTVLGRSKDGVTPDQLRNSLHLLADEALAATVPLKWRAEEQRRYRENAFAVVPASNGVSDLRRQYRRALVMLMGIAGLVLLIACANVANLLLARAEVRQREMAIRVALGAARGRVIRQLLTESVLLSTLGATLGLVFAHWGSRVLVAYLSPTDRPISLDLRLDHRPLLFSVGIAVLTGLAFGLVPAWRSARVAPNAALKANARGIAEGRRRLTVGTALVVAQISVSLTLIVGAGLLIGTFRKLATVDAGFRPDDVLLVSLSRPASASAPGQGVPLTTLLQRLRAVPGVASASLSQLTPLGNWSWYEDMLVDGFTPQSDQDGTAYLNEVSDGYFRTMGTPLWIGRDFDGGDRIGAPRVAVVNETMARHFYGTANPVGRVFRYRAGKGATAPYRIIGVAKDAKYQSLREKTLPTVYIAMAQDTALGSAITLSSSITAELRVTGGAIGAIPSIRSMIGEIAPGTSTSFVTFTTQVANSLIRERLLATLSGFFAALAVVLATMGLYGVMAYSVARRRNEIGIRMALGAGRRRVATMVLGEVSTLIVAGFILGVALSLIATRLIASFLFGLKPTDVATYAGSMTLLAAVALLAAYVPARGASCVDSMEALREE